MAEVRAVTMATYEQLADCLARSFYDDPLMTWIYPDDHRRLEAAREWWSLCLTIGVERGTVEAISQDGASIAGAIWSAPGSTLFDDDAAGRLFALLSAQLGDDEAGRVAVGLLAITERRPADACWYLFGLGVDPSRQCQGLGGRLVGHRLKDVDAAGEPAYLESSNPRNVPFYERLGFVVLGEIPLPDGPIIRGMRRAAAS